MLNVLLFASVREQLGVERITCALEKDIDALISALSRTHGTRWNDVLRAPNIIVAINQEVSSFDQVLRDGDEVAFFPPVTGG